MGEVRRQAGAAVMGGHRLTLSSLVLCGPGTGKTWLAGRPVETPGVPVRRRPRSAAPVVGGLTGPRPVRRGARAGLVARALLGETVAERVLTVDEADGISSHNRAGSFGPLLACLEPVPCGRLAEEAPRLLGDASHGSWLLTAGSTDGLPAPIVARLTIPEVPRPARVHLRAVADGVPDEAHAARDGLPGPPDGDVLGRLAAATPRRTGHAIVEAMARGIDRAPRAAGPMRHRTAGDRAPSRLREPFASPVVRDGGRSRGHAPTASSPVGHGPGRSQGDVA